MGASYAEALTKKSYDVDGFDHNDEVLKQALKEGIVKTGDINNIEKSDLVILALYPKENIVFISKHKNLFKKQILTDLSGTKSDMMDQISRLLPKGIAYTSHHPMSGRETPGYFYKNIDMFKKANFLIVPSKTATKKSNEVIETIAKDLSFGRITYFDAQTHDQLIAFTSQLTHLIAVSLINADHLKQTKDATGDSFKDLTRIAKINEDMWSELFLSNKQALIEQTNLFIETLQQIKKTIVDEDRETLKQLLKQAKEKRRLFD